MPSKFEKAGFSLVETVVGLGVMALVITGGLIALGQAMLLSEKSSEQILADFVLRGEVEVLRAASWDTLSTHHDSVISYNESNPDSAYPILLTFNEGSLSDMGLEAKVHSSRLNASGEIGKIAFRIFLSWKDRSGKLHEEARVLVITEGGFSADS
ncbi:MAG TPA: type II secretion system protein [Opitutales bacterium]|nr:type II secretion system protein [Opitutales bacterium]